MEKESVEMEQTEVLPYNEFADAIVTREDGLPATIFDILPTKTSAAAPAFDPESFNVDAVINENESVVSSGIVEWRDVYARGFTPCGRYYILEITNTIGLIFSIKNFCSRTDGRRPRILQVVTGNTTVTSFATVLTTSIVPTTVTFSVTLTVSFFLIKIRFFNLKTFIKITFFVSVQSLDLLLECPPVNRSAVQY